jgi:D-3-phosphoglycerate dehydrogenase
MHRVVVADPVAPAGLDLLREAGVDIVDAAGTGRAELLGLLAGADALLVRSRTRVDRELLEAGDRLRVVGRAGIGVDNIDLDCATELGILVLNVPSANLLSATEHTFALLLALARRVAAADAAMKAGSWDRKRFLGVELHGKTLGIIGFGRIGQQVALRARAFEMRVMAHDPFLDPAVAERLGAPLLGLDELLERSEVVSLHVPLTPQTRGLLGAAELARMKESALLVNCSRGGVVDESALMEALEGGRLGGAALDVFEQEPPGDWSLARHPRVVATPHLGAQTREAQDRASVEAARMVLQALRGSLDVSAVNLPFVWDGRRDPGYLLLAEQLGRLASALLAGSMAHEIAVDLWSLEEGLDRPLSLAAARGALVASLGDSVGYVNVGQIAASRGVAIVRRVHSGKSDYPGLIGVSVRNGAGVIDLAGTLFDGRRPRVVRFGRVPLEFTPEGRLLVLRSYDEPGVVGRVGTLLGGAGINIADIHLARKDGEEDAWTVLRLDEVPGSELLDRLAALPAVRTVRLIDLGHPWPKA